jgi:glycerol kinase
LWCEKIVDERVMSHILALDQGTSSSKAMVFNLTGRLLASVQHEFDMIFPADGWVEQDPEVIWRTTLLAAREALAQAKLAAPDIAAIGITNQRETTLVWDRETGECLHNAIVWQDRRTDAHCERIRADDMQQVITQTTGLLVDPYFSATKLSWLLDNVPGLRGKAEAGALCFGTVDSFLVWRLTKGAVHATDASNASRTLLYDIEEQAWSSALLEYFDIPAAVLPEVRDSAGDYGAADPEWLGASVPITGVAGDQQAALLGQACFEPGMAKSTYGTGCFAMINTGSQLLRSRTQLLSTVAYQLAGRPTYALEGSIFSAGVAVKWLRDELSLVVSADQTEAAALRAGGDTGGVYLVPAFTGLGAPHWSAQARGLIAGLTLATNRDQLITATLQSVGFQTQDLIDAMAGDGAQVAQLRIDGGMVGNDWLCQFLADILGIPVERPEIIETTALGAAILAALGAGLVSGLPAAAGLWASERIFQPAMDAKRRSVLMSGWHQAVGRALL